MSTADWDGQVVVILGAARQGQALARYLAMHGARVILSDLKPASEMQAVQQSLASPQIEFVFGGHPPEMLDGADRLCLSGGVPLTAPIVQEARRRGIPLSNDSQIFMEAAPCPVVGITGSAGKTTTTTLLGRICRAAAETQEKPPFRKVWVGGNIGSPLIADVDEMRPEDLAVVEFSSFQLEIMTCSPHVAVVLNITPNHLDRHGDMEAYLNAKRRILDFQKPGDTAILGRDDPGAWSLVGSARGRLISFGLNKDGLPNSVTGDVTIQDEAISLRRTKPGAASAEVVPLMPVSKIGLRGVHNLLNVLAACAAAHAVNVDPASMARGIEGFTGVAHRLEFVRSWGGASWYNDSIATTPERVIAAIRSFDEPLLLLLGGRDKKLPWEDLAELIHQRVEGVVLFGEAREKILHALQSAGASSGAATRRTSPLAIRSCSGLRQAVMEAADLARPGQVVLLSPGGTSFDEFKDFEERGQCFARWVNELP